MTSQDALKNIKKAVDWYKDDLKIDSLEGRLLTLQRSQIMRRAFGKVSNGERVVTFVDSYDTIKGGILCYGII